MRRSLTKIPYPVIGRATTTTTTTASSIVADFSTSSSGGRGGGGRGRGGASPFRFTVDSPSDNKSDNSKFDDASPPPQGHGRGRGKPLPSSPTLPSFSSFLNNESKAPGQGRGRGFDPSKSAPPPPTQQSESPNGKPAKPNVKPFLFVEEEKQHDSYESEIPHRPEKILPENINVQSGAGRGKSIQAPPVQSEKPRAENRHIRRQQQPNPNVVFASEEKKSSPREQLSQEEKVKKAVGILTKGDPAAAGGGGGGGGRGASEFRGTRGGRRGGRVAERGRRRERRDERYEESDDEASGLNLGDPADEEKVAKKLGPVAMNQLTEGFEEMASRVLPSPLDDAYVDALHTNLLIECEPEYLMEEFGTNPDIDEKPPMSLRDAFEKQKPFLMSYIGIQSQEEWEEIMEETMTKTVPLWKEIINQYCGPDRVTAKQQSQELERVANTLPASVPASVKRFTDRAVLSLQSNPGWGFDKKCQFMDKLVMEVSNQYK